MNPEFQRNLWLEASPRRIAWAGIVLALIYAAAASLARNNPYGVIGALGITGGFVFIACAIIWGARATGNSVLSEIADRTWDFQRLSALDPWSMTWGKLFGASSLPWLCGLTGVVFMVVSDVARGDQAIGAPVITMLAVAVLLQAVSLAAALIGVRKARAEGRIARAGGVLGGLILAVFLFLTVARSSGFQHGQGIEGLSSLWKAGGFIGWGSGIYPAGGFRAVGLVLFAGWAVIACWRLMRLELQMQNAPVAWPAFLVFLAIFAGGFAVNQSLSAAFTVGALAVALCAYVGAFAEPADRVRMRQFGQAVAARDVNRAAPLTPAPLAPLILAALLVLAGYATKGAGPAGLDLDQAAALITFLVRDLGVIALCRLGARPQRGDFNAVVALALLYGVGGIIGGATAGDRGVALFMPTDHDPLISLVSGAVQAALIWALAAARIRSSKA